MMKVSDTPSADAVSLAVRAVGTANTLVVKFALVAPAATVTEAGTVTSSLLLSSVTTCPLLPAAAVSVTVQVSARLPETDPLAQLSALTGSAV
jgi:hypothetical protein